MKKKICAVFMAMALALSLVACGTASAQSTEANNEKTSSADSNMKLKVIATPAPASCSQVAVAEELGYFKEEGVEVEIQYVTNLSDMASIIAGGGCDAAFNSYYTVMTWVDSAETLAGSRPGQPAWRRRGNPCGRSAAKGQSQENHDGRLAACDGVRP